MNKKVISAISTLGGMTVGAAASGMAVAKMKQKEIDKEKERANKNATVIASLARWITLMQDEISLVSFFEKYNYKTVAIYGMHYIGERLYRELTEAGIEVKYAIDQRRNATAVDVVMKKMTDELEEVDAVIVTPVYYFNSIEDQLVEILDCPIISFDEILEELEEEKETVDEEDFFEDEVLEAKEELEEFEEWKELDE